MYENRQPDHSVNVSRVHPLKQFLQLLLAAMVLVVVLVFTLQITGGWIGRQIPFGAERQLMQRLDPQLGFRPGEHPMADYLQSLVDRLAPHLPIPPDMQIEIHYAPDQVFNAFATLGGTLVFHRGLLERMPDENALAMVVAHEMAHVLHRDPAAGLGGGVASMLALMALTGNGGSSLAGRVLNSTGSVTSVQFTRRMENAADVAAINALARLYGHVEGADALFELFDAYRGESGTRSSLPQRLQRFLSTHPLDQDRIETIRRIARDSAWATTGPVTPLPDDYARWLTR